MNLYRDDQDSRRTFGKLMADDGTWVCDTLELPWLDNAHDVSCIPAGSYVCVLKYSPVHGKDLYWVTGVPDRPDIEIHIGNYVVPIPEHPHPDSKGCILVGNARNGDMLVQSTVAFTRFMALLNGTPTFPLDVVDVGTVVA